MEIKNITLLVLLTFCIFCQGTTMTLREAVIREDVGTISSILSTISVGQRIFVVNGRDDSGMSSLHLAIYHGKVESVNALITAIPPDQRVAFFNMTIDNPEHCMYGMTALHMAVCLGNTKIIHLLLYAGADISVTVNNSESRYNGCTVLHLAVQHDHVNAIFIFLAPLTVILNSEQITAFVNTADANGMTALHLAAMKGCVSTIQTLLAVGADVNVRDGFGCTALHVAAKGGYDNAIYALLAAVPIEQRAAFVNATINNPEIWNHEMTALHLAANASQINVVNTLIGIGADICKIDDHGRTALHWAANRNYVDIVNVLITAISPEQRVAFVNKRDKFGWTALHLAAQEDSFNIISILLSERADINATINKSRYFDENGWTALHVAVFWNRMRNVQVLLTAIPYEQRVTFVNIQDGQGRTALHLAAKEGNIDVVQTLLAVVPENQRIAFVNVEDNYGKTALHVAAQYNNTDVVQALIKVGAYITKDLVHLLQRLNVAIPKDRIPNYGGYWNMNYEPVQ